jgi:two-component system cell cycle response regulator
MPLAPLPEQPKQREIEYDMKILIVDDDPIGRTIVHRIVQRAGHQPLEAANGVEALALVEQEDPDVLITDLRMPLMHGVDLITAVRNSEQHRAMPIICLSGLNDRDAIAHLAAIGINEYLLKPVRAHDLTQRLEAIASTHAKWKSRREAPSQPATTPVAYVVDPQADSRGGIAAMLAAEFTVVELDGGQACVKYVQQAATPPAAAFIAQGLGLFSEGQLAIVLRRIATERSWPPPTIVLLADSSTVAAGAVPSFDAVADRENPSGVMDVFRAVRAAQSP